MGRIGLAWRILVNGAFATKVHQLLEAPPVLIAETPVPKPAPAPPKPARSDALSLLSALQREGRFVDFLKEPIDAYSDSQVGAAVRDIHRDCGGVLERQFAIRPVLDQVEGGSVSLGQKAGSGKIKLSGKVGDGTAASGTLVHHGWQSTKCDVPVWTGDPESASILAPAEVEVR